MSGTDASFLYFETPTSHMHVLGTIVVSTKDRPGWSADDVVALIRARLDLLPVFRRRIATATLRLHHPVWVDVKHVDVAEHVSRVHCPAPGTLRELAAEVSAFAARQLDRSRPLWECLVVEGLADDRAAVVLKVHHCAVDGVAAGKILGALFDLSAEGRTEAELVGARAAARSKDRDEPGLVDVALHTAGGIVARPLNLARLLPATGKALMGLVSHRRDTDGGAVPLVAPRAPFNGSLTAGRTAAFVSVPLADVKRVKAAVGGTFNDAVTALCGGAFREYLLAKDELPESSLIAVVPVSVRAGDDDEGANRVSAMFTVLGTDLADPVERLHAVRQANRVAKGDQAAVGDELVMRFGEITPPLTMTLAARVYSGLRLADRHPVVHNVVVSNVAGPPFQVFLAGLPVVGLYPLGPVLEGPGLNVTVVSYADSVGIGLIASDKVTDLDDLAAAFPRALAATLDAVSSR